MGAHLLLVLAGFVAGVMNAVAGGGSFATFPALVYTGVPSIIANASSTVALFPGAFASAWGYRDDFRRFETVSFPVLLSVSLLGGLVGALLLLFTPQSSFDHVIPWLLLLATIIFAFGPRLAPLLQRVLRIGPRSLLCAQFIVAIYGGYFGGAVGLMMLALWAIFGLHDLRALNATRVVLVGSLNAVAVVCFVLAGKIWWTQTGLMLVAAVAGGYLGARVARKLNPQYLRVAITALNILVTTVFFLRAYHGG
ncbi:MAG: sulfite exporter TauE/SafE family protein [Verrucomicrobia bacterium]|nr:sulfite exporter TauE/SafE family protein [Verrucomicrobiota bacterium]